MAKETNVDCLELREKLKNARVRYNKAANDVASTASSGRVEYNKSLGLKTPLTAYTKYLGEITTLRQKLDVGVNTSKKFEAMRSGSAEIVQKGATLNGVFPIPPIREDFFSELGEEVQARYEMEMAQLAFNQSCVPWPDNVAAPSEDLPAVEEASPAEEAPAGGDDTEGDQTSAGTHVLQLCSALCHSPGREGKPCGHKVYHPPCPQHRGAPAMPPASPTASAVA